MPDEAYLYLPPIDRVREQQDARGLLIHGLYHADRDETLRAWELFGELALIEDADFKLRQEGASGGRQAAAGGSRSPGDRVARSGLCERTPRSGSARSDRAGRDALGKSSLSETERARAILVMKSAVETLLESGRVDSRVIRVPLRMLTTGLVAEAEAATTAKAVRGGPPPGVAMLMRAMPEEELARFDRTESRGPRVPRLRRRRDTGRRDRRGAWTFWRPGSPSIRTKRRRWGRSSSDSG